MKDNDDEQFNIISNIIFLVSSLTIYNGVNKYKINKDFSDKTVTIKNPKTIKALFNDKDKKRLKKLKLGKDILNFQKVLINNFNSNNLNIMYNNLKNIEAKEKTLFLRNLLGISIGGVYLPKKNKIKILKWVKKDVIDHELFHMASTIYDEKRNIVFVGFAQLHYNTKIGIGRGLNEGYTEVLTSRYFSPRNNSAHTYKVCKLFASLLEIIVGKEKMENMYLSANLPDLIKELEKYDSKENIISFLHYWDYYLKYNDVKNNIFLFPSNRKTLNDNINTCISNIQNYLIKWFNEKIIKEEKQKIIDKDLLNMKINLYSRLTINDKLLKKYKIRQKKEY